MAKQAQRAAGLLPALLALAVVAPPARAEVNFGPIAVAVDPEPKGQNSHGYTEYRVVVRSKKGTNRSHTVTLSLAHDRRISHPEASIRSVSRTVEVGAGKVVPVSLLVPDQPVLRSSGLAVTIDGDRKEAEVPVNFAPTRRDSGFHPSFGGFPGGFSGSPTPEPLVLVSARLAETFKPPMVLVWDFPGARGDPEGPGEAPAPPGAAPAPPAPPGAAPAPPAPPGAAPAPPGAGPIGLPVRPAAPGVPMAGPVPVLTVAPGARGDTQLVRSDTPVTAWSKHWLGFSRYDGVVISRDELDELSRGARDVLSALWQYVEAGGSLLVLGPGEVALPASWRPRPDPTGLTVYSPGFGQCFVYPDGLLHRWEGQDVVASVLDFLPAGGQPWNALLAGAAADLRTRAGWERWATVSKSWLQTAGPWQAPRSLSEVNRSFPVVDDIGVPVKGLFALMILFAVGIGPVNLFVLGRYKRRIWLLWTVPALSLLTCVAVFGFMIVAEGWEGRAQTEGFTLLDEGEHRATTLGRTAFYTPLTPGDGLHFSPDTEVTPLGLQFGMGSSAACSVDWGGDQHLARGWVTARVPAHFALRKCEVRRERLNVTRHPDGSLTLVNGLGATARNVWYADELGALHHAGPVAPGDRATLTPAEGKATGTPGGLRERVYQERDWASVFQRATKVPGKFLEPRTYLAELEGTPFFQLEAKPGGAQEGLRGANLRAPRSLVLGIPAREVGRAR